MAETEKKKPIKNKLLAQVVALNEEGVKKVIKTDSRRTLITSEFEGHTLNVFNGREYIRLMVTDEIVARRKPISWHVPRHSHTASLRYVSIPPRKMRLVANMVKGMPIEKALNVLNFTPKIAARHVANTIKSAAANLLSEEGTAALNPEDLFVREVVVQAAPSAKRIRFQSMGRAFRYKKRHSHLSIKLAERLHVTSPSTAIAPDGKGAETVKKADAKTGGKKAAAKKTTEKKSPAKKTTAKKKTASPATKKSTTKKPVEKKKAGGGTKKNED